MEAPRNSRSTDLWSQTLKGSFSDFQVKTFEPKGEFGWHVHDSEDELFIAIQGEFILKLRDQEIHLKKGDSYLVPKGVEHTTGALGHPVAIVIRSAART